MIMFLLLLLAVAGTGYAIYRYLGDDLPKIESLAEYRPPVITAVYAEAIQNIVAGADVQAELDKAVEEIDLDIEDNQGYPMP